MFLRIVANKKHHFTILDLKSAVCARGLIRFLSSEQYN
jgi:hypothetical protein